MSVRVLFSLFAMTLAASGCAESGRQGAPSSQPSEHNPPRPTASQNRESTVGGSPSIASLTADPVIGSLGLPLGTVAEIHATIVDGDDLRMKTYQGAYLLRVTNVNGRPLEPSPVMEFSVPGFIGVELANDNFQLYEMKTGEKTGRLESDVIEDLQKDYVGREVKLAVYECGVYSGIPENLPDDVVIWQGHGFSFSTWLVILADRSSASTEHANIENAP